MATIAGQVVTNEASSGSLLPAGTLNSFRFTSTYDTNLYDVGGPGTNIVATVMKNGAPTAPDLHRHRRERVPARRGRSSVTSSRSS